MNVHFQVLKNSKSFSINSASRMSTQHQEERIITAPLGPLYYSSNLSDLIFSQKNTITYRATLIDGHFSAVRKAMFRIFNDYIYVIPQEHRNNFIDDFIKLVEFVENSQNQSNILLETETTSELVKYMVATTLKIENTMVNIRNKGDLISGNKEDVTSL